MCKGKIETFLRFNPNYLHGHVLGEKTNWLSKTIYQQMIIKEVINKIYFLIECLFLSNHIKGTWGTKTKNIYKCTDAGFPRICTISLMIRLHQRHSDVDKLLLSNPECSFPTKANIKLMLIVH